MDATSLLLAGLMFGVMIVRNPMRPDQIARQIGRISMGSREDLVDCPVCDGTAVSKYSFTNCQRCDATGKITKELYERLQFISKDLRRKLRELRKGDIDGI